LKGDHLESPESIEVPPAFPATIAKRLIIVDTSGGRIVPPWALSLLQLGWMCRSHVRPGIRLLLVAILPTRALAGPLASLGALFAGGATFSGAFTWDDMRALPAGSSVFWRDSDSGKRCRGEIERPWEFAPDLVPVTIREGPRAQIGTVHGVGKDVFRRLGYCLEFVPTARGAAALESALNLHLALGVDTPRAWIETAKVDVQLVTNQTRLSMETDGVHLGLVEPGQPVVSMKDALCANTGSRDAMVKLRIHSPGQALEDAIPSTILEGAASAAILEGLPFGNSLVLLERHEYSHEFRDFLLRVAAEAGPMPDSFGALVPASVPPGVELAGFALAATDE